MKLSAHMMFWASLVFAALCLTYALFGFNSIDPAMSGQELTDAHGFVGFWIFLGVVGVGLAFLARYMARGSTDD